MKNYYGCKGKDSEQGKLWESQTGMAPIFFGNIRIHICRRIAAVEYGAQMLLTGLLIMADWIASNTNYFP